METASDSFNPDEVVEGSHAIVDEAGWCEVGSNGRLRANKLKVKASPAPVSASQTKLATNAKPTRQFVAKENCPGLQAWLHEFKATWPLWELAQAKTESVRST